MDYHLHMGAAAARVGSERELRKRMPRLQTSTTNNKSNSFADPLTPAIATAAATEFNMRAPVAAGHQRFVLTDHVAFRYLEEDPSTTVLARRQKLEGYEVYLVEQWACSRIHPTFVITTYTGDPKDSVYASVLSVPTDESSWSPQLRIYFKAVTDVHARPKETHLGTLMITNLSSFPSSLTIIPVPDGDMKKHRELFFVNEDLKRLGCSGRLGIKLAPPSSATQAKFHQLYRTSDKIPLNSAVIELVKFCQVALVMFGKLEPEYADGLLCDVTEKAVSDWWVEFGQEYFTVEPHDGILGPTTVAALLGLFMGARNRLSAYNAPVAKDVFDIESTKRGIAYFQKANRLPKTRRLDRQTLEKLRRATAKAASKEGWAVPRAFKSTVAELGGKGGEMVMGIVGAGEKAGIADIETVDIDRFVDLVQGERAKWLWYGKPRKTHTGDMFSRLPGEDGALSPEAPTSATARLLKRESTLDGGPLSKRDTAEDEFGKNSPVLGGKLDETEKEANSKSAAIKRAKGKIESGSGFTRIKDVVGRRTHQTKSSMDVNDRMHLQQPKSNPGSIHESDGLTTPFGERRDQIGSPLSAVSTNRPLAETDTSFTRVLTETPRETSTTLSMALDGTTQAQSSTQASEKASEQGDADANPLLDTGSITGSVFAKKLPFTPAFTDVPPILRHTQSSEHLPTYHSLSRDAAWWPRSLSFSLAEDSVLTWVSPSSLDNGSDSEAPPRDLLQQLQQQEATSELYKHLRRRLAIISSLDAKWTEESITIVHELDAQADADIEQLEEMYYPRLDEYQSLREDAHEIVSRERLQLQEAVRDLETMGAKLEYEIHTLRGKVDDVEDGVQELERQIDTVEERCGELEDMVGSKEGMLHFVFRILTGVGRVPW
ncbi:hypothetical protein BU24DRAFT_420554 [Aaosphaeria arxii CBS 175.79]|uniref:STB6-like N-terminal domain-containing protein n=1 Tax=Aaosphaeria arxii CBS 175.79 TaxID=1450172 RepID=A0A6A5XX56_9PLEO|nr:uncharacterized protein BU24DRAFT_420554 [Aaosphaeria arxii CBS 175.79]KAF2017526.1 hypothetical protein BU24DRAFT_420554 [Aaosphaeria arxii CBS 175.79]